MRPVYFDTVIAASRGAVGRGDEIVAQLPDLFEGQATGIGLYMVRGADRLLVDDLRRTAHTGMVQLDHGQAAQFPDPGGDAAMPFVQRIAEDAQLAGKSLAYLLDMRSTGHHQAKSAFCPHGQPMELLIREHAILMALPVGHGGQHEPVGHGQAAGELDGRIGEGGHVMDFGYQQNRPDWSQSWSTNYTFQYALPIQE